LYISDEYDLVNEQGMLDEHGGGKGDIFAEVQNKYRRFARTDIAFFCLDTGKTIEADTAKKLARIIEPPAGFKFKVIFDAADLVYAKLVESKRSVKMALDAHVAKAKGVAEEFLRILPLPMCDSVIQAAFHHDDGKAHWLWQLAARGSSDGEKLAKVGYFENPMLLAGLRHELVSVLNNGDLNDLEAWLIASHRGRCRPMFAEKAYDPDRPVESAELNARFPAILDSLQRKYGYWGLAYLEALVRAVDINSE
jgi:hypothetical protein